MPITRPQLDSILISRLGSMMLQAGKDGRTADGTNPDLLDAVRVGFTSFGPGQAVPLSFAAVTTVDLLGIADADIPQVVDIAEWMVRRTCLDAYSDVDESNDQDQQKNDQLAARWEKRLVAHETYIRNAYSWGVSSLDAGTINLGFGSSKDPASPWWGFD